MLFRSNDLFNADLLNADAFTGDLLKDFERLTKGLNFGPDFPHSNSPAFDTVRTDERYEIAIDLPGVDPETVELTVDNRTLTLHASRELASGEQREFSHSFKLAEDLDTDELTATSEHGVLTVAIPVVAAPEPRKIQIN